MDATAAKDLVTRYYAAFNARDYDAYDQIFAPGAVVEAPGGLTATGPEGHKMFDGIWIGAFPDCRIESRLCVSDGRTVMSENRFTGTHDGDLPLPAGPLPPSGRRFDAKYVGVFEIEDGRVVRQRLHFDQVELLTQLGAVASTP
jgi:predicted ester cyclase